MEFPILSWGSLCLQQVEVYLKHFLQLSWHGKVSYFIIMWGYTYATLVTGVCFLLQLHFVDLCVYFSHLINVCDIIFLYIPNYYFFLDQKIIILMDLVSFLSSQIKNFNACTHHILQTLRMHEDNPSLPYTTSRHACET